jgi:hypothetical protein
MPLRRGGSSGNRLAVHAPGRGWLYNYNNDMRTKQCSGVAIKSVGVVRVRSRAADRHRSPDLMDNLCHCPSRFNAHRSASGGLAPDDFREQPQSTRNLLTIRCHYSDPSTFPMRPNNRRQ